MVMPLSALGSGVSVDYTTPTDPVLQIPFSAIASAGHWDTPPTVDDLDPWLWSVLQQLSAWNTTAPNTEHNVVVGAPTRGVSNRNGTNQRTTWTYSCVAFKKTPEVTTTPDADDI